MTDDDTRTTPLGLFNLAHSYWRSAVALQKAEVSATHPELPIWFLYVHAIELYLKSYFRALGTSISELRTKYGHRLVRLAEDAQQKGLHFDDEDMAVLALIGEIDLSELRYLKTGPFRRPTHQALDRTCKSFNSSVREILVAKGFKIREIPEK